MLISNWSSDVCSSDLQANRPKIDVATLSLKAFHDNLMQQHAETHGIGDPADVIEIKVRYLDAIAAGVGEPNERILVLGEGEHRSEEHTSELQSLMRISYAVFCLKKKIRTQSVKY